MYDVFLLIVESWCSLYQIIATPRIIDKLKQYLLQRWLKSFATWNWNFPYCLWRGVNAHVCFMSGSHRENSLSAAIVKSVNNLSLYLLLEKYFYPHRKKYVKVCKAFGLQIIDDGDLAVGNLWKNGVNRRKQDGFDNFSETTRKTIHELIGIKISRPRWSHVFVN